MCVFSCKEEDETQLTLENQRGISGTDCSCHLGSRQAKHSLCGLIHFTTETTEIRVTVSGINEILMTSESSLAYGD